MTYKKFTPPAVNAKITQGRAQAPKPVPLATAAKLQTQTSRQDIDAHLKKLTQLVEKDPKKAAEIFKGWLNKPSQIVKPKKAA
jgi:flagellar biosynthesis/type III secretory pathway M-ring protein FliF/YscJ